MTIVRTELELAADVIVRLVDCGLLPRTTLTVLQAAADVGIPLSALTAARDRHTRRGWRPPSQRPLTEWGLPLARPTSRRLKVVRTTQENPCA